MSPVGFRWFSFFVFEDLRRTALLSVKEAWCCSGVPAAGPAHWPVVPRDKIKWLWPCSTIITTLGVSRADLVQSDFILSPKLHSWMLCAEKWCYMGLWVGFPKSLIDLFHIRPAVHYHFGGEIIPAAALVVFASVLDHIDSWDLFITPSWQEIPKWHHDRNKIIFSPPQLWV